MRTLVHLLLASSASLAVFVGCGTDNSERAKAERFIQRTQTGYEISCTEIGARGDRDVWRCDGGLIAECWSTRKIGGDTVNWARPSRGKDLLKGCPPPQPDETTPIETEPTPTETSESAPDDTSAYAPEEDLAAIELGYRPDADNSTLRRLTYLLDRMEEECPANTRRQLADYTANTILQLKDVGVTAEPIEVLSDVRESSTLQAVDNCLDLFALYTILRKEQG
jgi:hypothetical protein